MRHYDRKGALELSIGTIVVIVIGMSMLVLGLVMVRTIFTGSTESVDTLNEGVMNEIVTLFDDEGEDLLINLGSTNVAKIKPGNGFNVVIGAQHPDGAKVGRETLEYQFTLAEDSDENCLARLGVERAEGLFITKINTWNLFDKYSGSNAFTLIQIEVPKGTEKCTQKVNVDMKIAESEEASSGDYFILEIVKEGIL